MPDPIITPPAQEGFRFADPGSTIAALEGLVNPEVAGLRLDPDKKIHGLGLPPLEQQPPAAEVKAPGNPLFNTQAPANPAGNPNPILPPKVEAQAPVVTDPQNPFFGKPKPQGGAPIDSWDRVMQEMSGASGHPITGPQDFEKVAETFKQLRADGQKLVEATKNLKEINETIAAMPADLKNGMLAWGMGKDYKAVIQAGGIDYSKDASDHGDKALINHFYPGMFKPEDWEGAKDNAVLQERIALAKDRYQIEKAKVEESTAAIQQDVKNQQAARSASVESAIASLKATFPEALPDVVESTRQALVSGEAKSALFNPDGTYSADAGVLLMFAKHKDYILNLIKAQAVANTTTKIYQEQANQQPAKPGTQGGGGSQQPANPLPQNLQLSMEGLNPRKTY